MEALNKLPDEELLALCKEGNDEAFMALYERHKNRVLNYSYTILKDREQAWDALQETFMYVFRKVPTYQPTAKFTTLIYKVVKHVSLGLVKKQKRFTPIADGWEEEADGYSNPPQENLIQKDEAEMIEVVLDSLPAIYREVLYLKIREDLEYKEIADILDCPIGTVKSRLHNGWKKIKEKLEKKNISMWTFLQVAPYKH